MMLLSVLSGAIWLTLIQAAVLRTPADNARGRRSVTGSYEGFLGPAPETASTLSPEKPSWTLAEGQTLGESETSQATVFSEQYLPTTSVEYSTSFPRLSAIPKSSSRASQTTLATAQRPSSGGILTASIASIYSLNSTQPTSVPTLTTSSTRASIGPFNTAIMFSDNIFADPIDTRPPPSKMKVRKDHPVPRLGIQSQPPLQTNKFFANFHLEDQKGPTYTFPYSVQWAAGKGATGSWGMAISHIEASQRVFGNNNDIGAPKYFLNPVGIQSMVISAKELGAETAVSMDSMTAFSARVHLGINRDAPPAISFPLIQGMAYITAEFSGSTPLIQSGKFFKTVTKAAKELKDNMNKFTFTLEDGTTWRLYAWATKGEPLDLNVVNNGMAESKHPFHGIIQIAKDPGTPGSEKILDDGAGAYAKTLELSGFAKQRGDKTDGTYSFNFKQDGHGDANLYLFALPHHIDSFDDETTDRVQKLKLQSTTKGIAALVKGKQWTMVEEDMPVDMGFAPWHPENGTLHVLSDPVKELIKGTAAQELGQNIVAQTNLDSMYFSGKALHKFGQILFVANDMLDAKDLVDRGLGPLKAAFAMFADNQQKFPLMYETAWGGVVSSASYVTGNSGADFGNTYYNDHHFHYGYHILAAALLGHLDPAWIDQNREYVNTLVRDIANPSKEDTYFPQWRNFDWYHGHSWAHGLYAAADGKDQESSSEDMMHAYALKMWGKVSGNKDLEARGNLQLSIIARSLQHYYLYQDDNMIQPSEFIANKVGGIVFENKIDHTTYFSPLIEAIQGIHMIPILAPSAFVRSKQFVREEWEQYWSDGRIDNVRGAWKGIIFANYAIAEPQEAFNFFSGQSFSPEFLDGGASLTWFQAYSAAIARA